jgi:purine-binding chemotaxis protein CheW
MRNLVIEESDKLLKDRYLVFNLSNGEYCIKLYHVKEILENVIITKVPHLPAFIRGVTNVRGKVLPLMDLNLRIGINGSDYNGRTCVIVAEHEKGEIGLIVNRVVDVLNDVTGNLVMDTENRKNAGSESNDFVSGIINRNNKITYVLNFNQLVSNI